jgi:catechol 2,3-dioxygenase-like lactoylglutathione lyase family enzyme
MMRRCCGMVGALLLLGAASAQAQEAPRLIRSDAAVLPMIYGVRVSAANLARSERFYREALGARRVTRVAPTEIMVQFQSGLNIMVSQRPAAAGSAPSPDGAGGGILEVSDIEAVLARVEAAGSRVIRAATSGSTSPGVRTSFIRDPDGVGIEVVQLPASQPAMPPVPAKSN